MSIELVEKFLPYVDEQFSTESKKALLTNQDFDWEGAHSVRVYKISTSKMNDYGRNGPATGQWSRYGEVAPLSATTERMALRRDRSFTFVIDKLDEDETAQQLEAANALARQNREVTIPEIDAYTYTVMCSNAGGKPETYKALTATTIYTEILAASQALDDAEVPETERVLVVTPATYALMKKCKDITMETDVGNDLRLNGVIARLDGMDVQKIPANRLPTGFEFMVAHPCATVAPVKLEDFNIHQNPPGISGSLVEGRVVYDAFVLENKARGIYYYGQPITNPIPGTTPVEKETGGGTATQTPGQSSGG